MCKAVLHKKPSAEIKVQALVVSFEEAGDPFEDDGGCLFALNSKVIVDAAAMTAVSSVIAIGIQQYNNFVEEGLEKRTKPVKKPLQKNKLHVFVQQRKAQKSSLTILCNGCSLFSRLYIACQTRKGDLPEFFRHENQPTPPSLSKLGDKRDSKKTCRSVLNAPLLVLEMLMRKKSWEMKQITLIMKRRLTLSPMIPPLKSFQIYQCN